jgi:hypothetical protein
MPGYWLLVVGVAAMAFNFLPLEFLAITGTLSNPKQYKSPYLSSVYVQKLKR